MPAFISKIRTSATDVRKHVYIRTYDTVKTLVFATNNAHKLEELRAIASDAFDIRSLADIGCHDDIPEDADTLEGNARQKARWVYDRYGVDCFADDTGLEVDALGGAPGVRTARYAPGAGHDSQANIRLLLHNLRDVPEGRRTARFRTAIVLVTGGEEHLFEGVVEGSIAAGPRGDGGFGYDPVFVPQGWHETFAEAGEDAKNAISHRARATQALAEYLRGTKE